MSTGRPKLLLIDANSLIHQAYHAVGPLTTRDHTPTNAVFGFVNMVLRVLEDERPDALALARDTPEPTFRHERYPEYKAHREPLEEALIAQFPIIDEVIDAFRWPVLKRPGFEADDILATLACRAAAEGWEVALITADRDLCQVADDHVTILATQGRGVSDVHHFTPAAVQERFGVPPSRLPDWKGLVGDSSDNIPGVRGIGPKTATELLQQFGDLDAVLAAADQLKGKRREMLLESADIARLSRELATVCREVPVDLALDSLRRQPVDDEAVQKLFVRLEFGQLLRRLSVRSTAPAPGVSYVTVTDDATAARVAAEVAECGAVGLAWRDDVAGLAISAAPGRAWYVPLARSAGRQLALFDVDEPTELDRGRLEQVLAPLTAGRVGWVAHDVQRLYQALGADHPALSGLRGDSHLAAWLLDPEQATHTLTTLASRYFGGSVPEPPDDHADPGAFACCLQADLTRRLEPRLREDLAEEKLLDLYRELELPTAPLLARMMARGVVVDRPAVRALDDELAASVAEKRQGVHQAAGVGFNIDSPKQLGEVLFEQLGLAHGRKTKTGWSTDATTLRELRDEHPVVSLVLEYRELAKLKSTYTEALLSLSDPVTGRIHTRLNQTGTATGRLSSSQPNLQNIPVRGGWGERFRNLFGAPEGWRLLAADYSQIELRVLAHVSGDPQMIGAFRRGEDIHTLAAQEIFGVAADDVAADQRRMAKVLNFGVAYGIQAHGLSQQLQIPRGQAQELIDAYFARFPLVKQYADDTIARAREQGFVQTLMGRRRRLADLSSRNPNLRQAAERAAINMPIQGAASDIIKVAMLRLDEQLSRVGAQARLVLQVHDELLVEVPPGEVPAVARLMRRCMEQAAELDVPLQVKVEVGTRWGSLEPLED